MDLTSPTVGPVGHAYRWPCVILSEPGRKLWKGLWLNSSTNDPDLIHMLIINKLLLNYY